MNYRWVLACYWAPQIYKGRVYRTECRFLSLCIKRKTLTQFRQTYDTLSKPISFTMFYNLAFVTLCLATQAFAVPGAGASLESRTT